MRLLCSLKTKLNRKNVTKNHHKKSLKQGGAGIREN